jgi:YD repeat-containing protein
VNLQNVSHGRFWHKTTPEQGTCTYTYFADDQLQTVTDSSDGRPGVSGEAGYPESLGFSAFTAKWQNVDAGVSLWFLE